METLIIKIAPVMVCLVLGAVFRTGRMISEQGMDDLKFIVINVALPPVLFQAFSKADITPSLLLIPVTVFLFCFLLFGLGEISRKMLPGGMVHTPFFTTGFEFGMIGSALLISLYGISSLKSISLMIIGHELFIWLAYFPMIGAGRRPLKEIAAASVKSPVLIAIAAALLLNVTGAGSYVLSGFSGNIIDSLIQTLANLIAPLILFIIGYNIRISAKSVMETLPYLFLRFFLVTAGGAFLFFIIYLINRDYIVHYYVYIVIFLMLPPPYILPLFIGNENRRETEFFSGANVYYTIFSFVAIFVFLLSIELNVF